MQRDKAIGSGVLVDQRYWDEGYARIAPNVASANDTVRLWIEAHLAPAQGDQHALEVGCYPGRYLAVMGQLGYAVHGIDLTPNVANIPAEFERIGLRTGTFVHADFLEYAFDRRFDVVCSFGFIEHFDDWEGVLRKHASLVGPGGSLVIETPNFRGSVQRFFHTWLDAENYARHNIAAMEPEAWAAILRTEGFTVTFAGWFGTFEFWHDSPQNSVSKRIGYKILRWLTPWFQRSREGHASLSPYCGLIAVKR